MFLQYYSFTVLQLLLELSFLQLYGLEKKKKRKWVKQISSKISFELNSKSHLRKRTNFNSWVTIILGNEPIPDSFWFLFLKHQTLHSLIGR